MRDYREKLVSGMSFNGKSFRKVIVTVRMTSDKLGQSISFEDGENLIMVPLESIRDIVTVTKKD